MANTGIPGVGRETGVRGNKLSAYCEIHGNNLEMEGNIPSKRRKKKKREKKKKKKKKKKRKKKKKKKKTPSRFKLLWGKSAQNHDNRGHLHHRI